MTGEIKAALAVAMVAALGWSHWYAFDQGREVGKVGAVTAESGRKDVVISAITARAAEHAAERANNEATARKVSNDVQTELAAVRDFQPAVIRVQLPALSFPSAGCSGAGGSAEAAGASGPDGTATGTVVFPEEVQRAFDRFTEGAGRLGKEADAATAVARGHQEFARKSGLYGNQNTDTK